MSWLEVLASHISGLSSIPCYVGFVVDELELRCVYSEYFSFPRKSSFLSLLHTY
jgi:hypothetical protein